MKVAIVGGPGIGKSTLVRQLGDLYHDGSYGEGEKGVWDPRVLEDIEAGRNPVGVTAYFAALYDANYRSASAHDGPGKVIFCEGARITLEAHIAEYPPQYHEALRRVAAQGDAWRPDRVIVLTSSTDTIENHILRRSRAARGRRGNGPPVSPDRCGIPAARARLAQHGRDQPRWAGVSRSRRARPHHHRRRVAAVRGDSVPGDGLAMTNSSTKHSDRARARAGQRKRRGRDRRRPRGDAADSQIPTGKLAFGGFTGQFGADGTFTIAGQGWPTFAGTWKADGPRVELVLSNPPTGCAEPATYTVSRSGTHVTFSMEKDTCQPRRMILDRSTWRPADEAEAMPARTIARTAAPKMPALPAPSPSRGSWPSFRGTRAAGVADGQQLPDTWNVTTGENILWKAPIPGLGHSSPIVWGNLIFVTSRHQRKAGRHVQAGPVWRRRCIRRPHAPAVDHHGHRQEDGKGAVEPRGALGRAAQQAAHQVHVCERDAGDRRANRGRVVRIGGHPRL